MTAKSQTEPDLELDREVAKALGWHEANPTYVEDGETHYYCWVKPKSQGKTLLEREVVDLCFSSDDGVAVREILPVLRAKGISIEITISTDGMVDVEGWRSDVARTLLVSSSEGNTLALALSRFVVAAKKAGEL